MKSVLGLVFACGLTASAAAQCNLYLNGVPDFDQRRNSLPNDGGMYCVPTSAVNLMGYIANHGVPGTLSGPRNWQSQANYGFVSGRLTTMGGLMDTDPFDGTYGGPAETGLETYLLVFAPGKFTVSYYYGNYGVGTLAAQWTLGNLVNVCYGYYPVSNGRYSRDGGHCVSLTGLVDYCDPSYRIRWRDPANDSANLDTQSVFANKYSDASSQTFIATDGLPRTRIRLWDLGVDSTTRRYLDTYFSINPLVALTGGVSHTNYVHINRPVQLTGLTPPSSQSEVPGNDPIVQIAMGAQQLDAFIVTSQLIPRQQKVFQYDLASGAMVELLASSSTMRVATSRHGHLFVFGDGSVRKYDVGGRTPTLLQEVTPPSPVDAMAYDDARDELVVITSSGRLVRYHQDLAQPAIDEPLPSAVQPGGSISLAIDQAAQKYYVCGSGDPTIFVVGLIPGAPRLRIESTLSFPGVASPQELQFTDEGTLLLLNNGAVAEFARGAAGGWAARADSILAGLPGAGGLCVARSRSNFVAGVHDTPEWRNVTLPEGVADVPDCIADFNNDGLVNSQDFFDFLTAFFSQDPASDSNADGLLNSQDFFDFLRAFFAGC